MKYINSVAKEVWCNRYGIYNVTAKEVCNVTAKEVCKQSLRKFERTAKDRSL